MNVKTLVIITAVVFLILSFQMGVFTAFAVACYIPVLYDFFMKQRAMPIGELALLLGGFQWIVSPLLAYSYDVFEMSMPIELYMRNTGIMYCAFMLGYYLFRKDECIDLRRFVISKAFYAKVAKTMIAIGVVSMALQMFINIFVLELCKELMFVGVLIFMYLRPDKAVRYAATALGLFMIYCIRNSGYHELIVWGIFYTMCVFCTRQYSLLKKIMVFVAALFVLNTLQTVKFAIRAGGDNHGVAYFTTMFWDTMFTQSTDDTETNVSERFNQGWIISDIYKTIPDKRDYYYGETIFGSITSSMLPGFMYGSNRINAEVTKVYFSEFTGHPLSSATSMGLSVLGEGYGNFGLWGGAVFMFVWGLAIAYFMSLLFRLTRNKDNLWFFLIPIICHDLYKAELSFFKVFNWTFKGVIFAFLVIYVMNKLYTYLRPKRI